MKNPFLEREGVLPTDNIKCPNCGCIISYGESGSLKESTEAEFVENPDPYLTWYELHECLKCETLHTIENNT